MARMPSQREVFMDEDDARRVLLAQAVESAGDGILVPPDERERIDRAAREEALREAGARQARPERLLRLRADRVIGAVAVRDPGLAALAEPSPWPVRAAWLVPLAAFVAGAASDWAGDPHRVNLLSLPLVGLLAWNLVVYLLLLAGLLRRGPARRPLLAGLGAWTDGEHALRRRGGSATARARMLFHKAWLQATRRAEWARWARVLHLSAAGWALGWLGSLVLRGMVVEYRVGWESTFLGPTEVHALLSAMRGPAGWLGLFPPLGVQEVAALHFSAGGGVAAGGRPWVLMVAVLLLTVVVIPRLVLAAVARVQESFGRRRAVLDLDDAYFKRILTLLDTQRLRVEVVATSAEALAWFRRRFAADPQAWPVLGVSSQGDELRLDLDNAGGAGSTGAIAPASAAAPGGVRALWAQWRRLPPPADEVPPVAALCVLGEGPDARQFVDRALKSLAHGRPLLVVTGDDAPWPAAPGLRVLRASEVAACWVQQPRFFRALADSLPTQAAQAVERIARARAQQDALRLQQAMQAAALHLMESARQQEELHGLPSGVERLLPAVRDSVAQARQQAMDGILARVRASDGRYLDRLQHLYGLDADEMAQAGRQVEGSFRVAAPVHAQQAGVAGLATGAALGAGVDLATGGLTLGAAAALGALLGGGAAYVGALWKNRSTPGGATVVQLSDAMLVALAQASLLQYLAVVHAPAPAQHAWAGWVDEALQARASLLLPFWSQSRTQPDVHRLSQPLGHVLETCARQVLARAHPGSELSS